MAELTVSFITNDSLNYIQHALESLKETQLSHHIIVLVKASMPVTKLNHLRENFPHVEFIVSQDTATYSFSNNHNSILRQVTTPFVALLNDDIKVHGQALDILVTYLKENQQVALVGPQLLNPDGTPQVSQYSHPALWRVVYKISGLARLTHQHSPGRQILKYLNFMSLDSLQTFDRATSVDIVKGTAMIVRNRAIQEVGLLDESFHLYVEEFDWQWRLETYGWQRVIVPDAKITHYGTKQAELLLFGHQLKEDRRSILNYFIKYRNRWQVIIVRIAIICSHTFWGLFWILWDRSKSKVHFETTIIGLRWNRPEQSYAIEENNSL